MSTWPPIGRDELKAAASSSGFDMVFPVLMRRLIAETADGLVSLDMPGGGGTAVGGFDGVVRTLEANPFVPSGTSVWELSVGGGQTKANYDYSQRLVGPNGLATEEVAYIEAILVTWSKARAWETERQKDQRWREVRAYNLDRIDAWLEQAPATTVWLANVLGKALPGTQSLGEWWTKTWLPSTRIPLDGALVLAGREKAAEQLAADLERGIRLVSLSGDLRPEETGVFVAAALQKLGPLDASALGSRALLVSDTSSLSQLIRQQRPLVLLLRDAAMARDLPVSHPHQLIVTAYPGEKAGIEVPRLDSRAVQALLEARQFGHEEAAELGTLGRRSLLALRRKLATQRVLHTPSWALAPDTVQRRLLLVGSWLDGNPEDRRIITDCIGQPYDRVHDQAQLLATGGDIPFLGHVNDIWHVLAVQDSWDLLAASLTPDDLGAFKEIAMEVLTELDPVLDLDPSERWKAGILGARRRFSSTLRNGLAQSLAALGTLDAPVSAAVGSTTRQFARVIVRDLLSRANQDHSYRLWSSLGDILSLLAEAAPDEFVDAMRPGLGGSGPAHIAMFQDQKNNDLLTPRSPHLSFLSALETIAWTPGHIDDAADILAGLAVIDPGGSWSNRPMASLIGILSTWCPNTSTPLEDRIRCIGRIQRKHPQVGRKLLLSLIPDNYAFQFAHSGPKFRDWKQPAPVVPEDVKNARDSVVEMLIERLESEPDLYVELIEKIADIPARHRSLIAERLRGSERDQFDDALRTQMWEALRKKIADHKEFADAFWALPPEQLAPLEDACAALTPENPELRHRWLFVEVRPTLGDFSRRDDYSAYDAELAVRRAPAVGDVLAEAGLDGVLRLVEVGQVHAVGEALADHSPEYDHELLGHLEAERRSPAGRLAQAYFWRRLRQGEEALRDELVGSTDNPEAKAALLRLGSDPVSAWKKLEQLSPAVGVAYWKEFEGRGLGSDFPGALPAARALLKAGRPAAALELLLLYKGDNAELPVAQLAADALEGLLSLGMPDAEIGRLGSWNFDQAFNLLGHHVEVLGRSRIVNLEWQLLPISGHETRISTIHQAIVEEPEFFSELVKLTYRAESPTTHDAEDSLDEQGRTKAFRAHDVLTSCHLCPGMVPSEGLHPQTLRDWVDQSRIRLETLDRKESGDEQIGRLLSYSPKGADGFRLHEAVRDLIEDLGSDAIERGLEREIFNSRGGSSRDPFIGGTQERELAAIFMAQAEGVRAWARTRRIFKRLAETYLEMAQRHDADAERRSQGLGW